MKRVPVNTPLPLFYVGPDLSSGPLPAIFYFALSAKESLLTDPFNQPVAYWQTLPCRIFSVDLPFHGEGFSAVEAMTLWAQAWEKEQQITPHDFLGTFLADLTLSIDELLKQPIISSLSVAGLSRGGFIAYQIAARFPYVQTILTFAPLTEFVKIKEMKGLGHLPALNHYLLASLKEPLAQKTSRAYIGNRDTRVDTNSAFAWIRSLVETAHEQHIRAIPIELIIKPSIGNQGHGTSKETFEEGAAWLWNKL